MKIAFLGMPGFGAIILEKLNQSEYKPDSVNQLENIRKDKPDLIIVANFGEIIPQEILDIPRYGSLNVHPSLLPKYRGATPVQSAILNGDVKTGVTVMLMDAQIDHGPILAQKETVIGQNETYSQLHDRLALLGSELLIDTLPDWMAGRIELREQNHKLATYTKTLTRENGEIDWKKPVEEIERKIRAFYPWPGVYAFYEKNVVKINGLKQKKKEKRRARMKILKARLEKGKLIIEQVQPEGRKPMNFQDFLRGHPGFKIIR